MNCNFVKKNTAPVHEKEKVSKAYSELYERLLKLVEKFEFSIVILHGKASAKLQCLFQENTHWYTNLATNI